MHRVKIGNLYLYDLITSNEYPESNFISSIELRPDLYEKYSLNEATALLSILSKIGLNGEVEEITEE